MDARFHTLSDTLQSLGVCHDFDAVPEFRLFHDLNSVIILPSALDENQIDIFDEKFSQYGSNRYSDEAADQHRCHQFLEEPVLIFQIVGFTPGHLFTDQVVPREADQRRQCDRDPFVGVPADKTSCGVMPPIVPMMTKISATIMKLNEFADSNALFGSRLKFRASIPNSRQNSV